MLFARRVISSPIDKRVAIKGVIVYVVIETIVLHRSLADSTQTQYINLI